MPVTNEVTLLMDRYEHPELIQRFMELAEDERYSTEEIWKDITSYLLPDRKLYLEYGTGKDREHYSKDVFDGHPIAFLQLASRGIYGNTCSENINWVDTIPTNERYRNDRRILEHMQGLTHQMYREYSLSNWYAEAEMFIKDGLAMGTATMFHSWNYRKGTSQWDTRNPAEIYVFRNEDGDIDCIFRKFEMHAQTAVMMWPDTISEDVTRMAASNPWAYVTIVHACIPRRMYDPGVATIGRKKWGSYFKEYGKNKEMLDESGYDLFPYINWQMERASGEDYGRGIGHLAYYDIKTLNVLTESGTRAAQLGADPPVQAPEELEGKLRNRPHGVTFYEDPSRLVHGYDQGFQYPITKDMTTHTMDVLKQHFMVDLFMMLQQQTGRMTAFEVSERIGEKVQTLGPIVSGLAKTALDHSNELCVQDIYQHRKFPAMPAELKQEGVNFDYIGPLAMAQKRLEQGQGMQRALQEIIPVLQIDPTPGKAVNWYEWIKTNFRMHNIPVDLLTPKREFDEMLQREAQAAQQQQQAEMAAKLGQGMAALPQPTNAAANR